MEFVSKCLLGSFQSHISTSPCILCKDWSACKTKQIIFLEVLGNGTVHLTEVAPVALIKDYHHPLLKYRMVLVLLHKDGELLDGGDYNPIIVITTILILIFQLSLKHCSGSVPVSSPFLKAVILLHGLVVKVFPVHDEKNLVYVREPGSQLGCLE